MNVNDVNAMDFHPDGQARTKIRYPHFSIRFEFGIRQMSLLMSDQFFPMANLNGRAPRSTGSTFRVTHTVTLN